MFNDQNTSKQTTYFNYKLIFDSRYLFDGVGIEFKC